MTEPEPRIIALIEAHAPAVDGTPDWEDVVRRASAPAGRTRLLTAPRVLLIAATMAVLLAGSAVAGVGPGRILLGLVRSDEPAPAPVKHALRHIFRWPHGTHVILREARLVSRQTQIASWPSGGPPVVQTVENWIAPLRDGGYCSGQHFVPTAGAGEGHSYACVHGPLTPAVRLIQVSPSGWRMRAGRVRWDPWILDGTAPLETARVVLVHRDGTQTRVPLLRRPIGGLRYFAVRLRPQDAQSPARPAAIVALDADGRRIDAAPLTRRDVRPLISAVDDAGRAGQGPAIGFGSTRGTFQGVRGTAHLAVEVDPKTGRARCLDVDFTSDTGHATDGGYGSCTAPIRGMAPSIDTNLGIHVAFGSVPDGTATLTMTLKDGTRVGVPVHRHTYVALIGNALFRSGNLPVRLVARTAGGRVAGRYVFRLHRDFMDY